MSDGGGWSPDDPLGTETFEAWDEALDSADEGDEEGLPASEGERSIDRQLFLDEVEVDEAGVRLDDPERMAVLDGGADDPDGVDGFDGRLLPRADEEGWDLDADEDVALPE